MRQVERRTHEKHVEDQAELADESKRAKALEWKDGSVQVGRDPTKQRRTEHDARQHLADYLRLSKAAKQSPQRLRGGHHYRDLNQEREQMRLVTALINSGFLEVAGFDIGHRRRVHIFAEGVGDLRGR